ncbi:hypothetical protein [Peribacillus simplex]|uniref:hypothetical protein n=1 Tax=Peribacillus simplex TaxID=1478 RepID=UPI003D2C484D
MSSEKTPNLGLHKWASTDSVLRTELNENFAKLDEKTAEVTAQLGDTAKLSINALHPPIPLVAAKFDGTNDTSALQALVSYLVEKGGGKIVLPPKASKCNIIITGKNITVEGAGSATVLQPFDLTKPVISLGNGVTQTYNTTLQGMSLVGDALTNTSDGLVIDGVSYLKVDDFNVLYFGRDNVRITSTGTQPTQFIHFSSFSSKRALGSCLNVDYGIKWVTSTYFTGTYLEGRKLTGATTLNLTGLAVVAFANSYIQCGGSKQGHIVFNTDGAKLKGQNLSVDVDSGSTSVVVEIKSSKRLTNNYLLGTIGINGKIEYSDATQVNAINLGDNLSYHSVLSYPIASNGIIFPDGNASPDVLANATESNSMLLKNVGGTLYNYATGNGGTAGTMFYGSAGTPASSTATGVRGQMMWDANYVYFCIATNSWIRVAKDTAW